MSCVVSFAGRGKQSGGGCRGAAGQLNCGKHFFSQEPLIDDEFGGFRWSGAAIDSPVRLRMTSIFNETVEFSNQTPFVSDNLAVVSNPAVQFTVMPSAG